MENKEITVVPFSWNDNLSEVAIEDFESIRPSLSYCVCQSIGMALAKLELIEQLASIGKIDLDLDLNKPNAPSIVVDSKKIRENLNNAIKG